MKTTLLGFALCFLFATAAFGQTAGVISGEISPLRIVGHPERAYQRSMASEQVLLEQSAYTSAKGERPLREVAPAWHAIPLGDVARALKKEHATAKKAEIVWEN
jgi:hypothetical protein